MSNSFIMTESIVRPAKMPYGRLKDNGFVGIEGEHAARALVVETKDDLSAFASINLIIDDLDCGAMTKTTIGSTTMLSMTLTSSMIGRSGRKICQLIMVNSGNTVVQKSSQFEAYVGRANEIARSVDDGVTIIILSEAVTEMAQEAAEAAAQEAVADVVADCQAIADAASASADAAAQSASDAQTAAESIVVDSALDATSTHALQNKVVTSEINALKADLGAVSAYERSDNLFDVDSIESGLLNTTSSVVANASYYTSDFIPVTGQQSVVFQAEASNISTSTDTIYFFEYNENKTKIGSRQSFTISRGNKTGTFSTGDASTAYIRVSYVASRYTDVMIHIGSEVVEYQPYYVMKSEIAKSADVSALAEQISDVTLLPTTYNEVETTITNGVIRTNKEVYNPSEGYAGRYISIPVSEGEVYSVSGYSLNSYYPCAFVRTETTVETLLGGTNMPYSDTVITIPANYDTLYINGNIDYQVPVIKEPSRVTQEEFEQIFADVSATSNSQYPLKCLYKNGVLFIKKKYNDNRDLVVSFANVGGNSLFNFNSAFLLNNTDVLPSDDFTGANAVAAWSMSGSDWLAPYKVTAVNNADGDTPANVYFTGGNHRTTNAATGGGATAAQQSLSIFVNGNKAITENVIYPCESVLVKWSNNVQAYNTSKADGTGRAVLNESWMMVVDKDGIRLHNTIKALEDINIKTYYGLQATNISNKQYRYIGGETRSAITGGTVGNSGNNTCRDLQIWDSDFNLTITINPTDLGLFAHNEGYSFFATSSKLYGYVIGGDSMLVPSGAYLDLIGSYTFR